MLDRFGVETAQLPEAYAITGVASWVRMGQEGGVNVASEVERFVRVARMHDEADVVGVGKVKCHIQSEIVGDTAFVAAKERAVDMPGRLLKR